MILKVHYETVKDMFMYKYDPELCLNLFCYGTFLYNQSPRTVIKLIYYVVLLMFNLSQRVTR